MAFSWVNTTRVCTGHFGPADPKLGEPDRFADRDETGQWLRCDRTTFAGAETFSNDFHYGMDARCALNGKLLALATGVVTGHPQYTNSHGVNYGIEVRVTDYCSYLLWHVQPTGRAPIGTHVIGGVTPIALGGMTGTTVVHSHDEIKLLDRDVKWRWYNPERFMPPHSYKLDSGVLVPWPAGDLIHIPRATVMVGKVTPKPGVSLVYVREKPDAASLKIGTGLKAGTSLPYDQLVVGVTPKGTTEGHWFEVAPDIYDNGWGFVSAAFAQAA